MINTRTGSRAPWLFALPAIVAVATLTWSVVHPTVVCTSGGDTSTCVDYSTMKFFVATAGVGTGALMAALLGLILRLQRTVIAAAMVVGLALIGLAIGSLVRV